VIWVLEDRRLLMSWGQQRTEGLLAWPLCRSCRQLLWVPLATCRLELGQQRLMVLRLTGLHWAASQMVADSLQAAAQRQCST
jgi:hypothetical protein